MVPSKLELEQLPVVVTAKLYTVVVVILAVGVPDIVTKPEAILKLIPTGSPVTVAPVAPSNIRY